MRQPPTPTGNNGNTQKRRGAIRTHLGRKRTGPRGRPLRDTTLEGLREAGESARREQEAQFDRLLEAFNEAAERAGEMSAAAFDHTLDAACQALVHAGEFTAESAQRMREFLRRDLLQRDHPGMTFRTGDITSAGTFTCAGCGWTVRTDRTTLLPPCPQCTETAYRKGS
jgi:hypothetical protein